MPGCLVRVGVAQGWDWGEAFQIKGWCELMKDEWTR